MALPKPNHGQFAVSIAAIIALAVMATLVWGFARQLALARQMRVEEVRLEQAMASEQARHDDLAAQLTYVESDEYVEHWARTEAKMARQGEVVVVPPADVGEEPDGDQQLAPPAEPEAQPIWAEWWELVFGE